MMIYVGGVAEVGVWGNKSNLGVVLSFSVMGAWHEYVQNVYFEDVRRKIWCSVFI